MKTEAASPFMRQPGKRLLLLPCCALIVSLALNPLAMAATSNVTEQVTESELRVAYVFNFTKFVSWPPGTNTDEHLTVCTYNAGAAQSTFSALNDRSSGNQSIQVVDINDAQDSNINRCDFLYMGGESTSSNRELLSALRERTVLTISEQPLPESAAMVSLLMVDNKIAFEVDLQALRNNGLTVSSYMLRLAMRVYE
jgi:hypothetical protein